MNSQQIDIFYSNEITQLNIFVLYKLCDVLEYEKRGMLKFYSPINKIKNNKRVFPIS